MSRFAVLIAVVFALGLGSRELSAHPHMFIDNVTTLVMKDGKVVALRHNWRFDGFFSAMIKTEFDQGQDGVLGTEEIAVIQDQAFSALEDFNYFTWALTAGQVIDFTPESVSGFSARIDGQVAVYDFTLTLPEPVEVANLSFSVRDDSFYVDVALDKHTPVVFDGRGGEGCTPLIGEDPENPIYGGFVYPIRIDFLCAKS